MMFDNTPEPAPSRWAMIKGHLPILLLIGGGVGLFIGLHTAATAVAVVAAGHVVVAAVAFGARWMFQRRNRIAA